MRPRHVMDLDGLASLLRELAAAGYRLIGPRVRDRAIVHAEIAGLEDLPAGWTARHEAGASRLERRTDGALFGYAVGPSPWKQELFVPRVRLVQIRRRAGGLDVTPEPLPDDKLALIGVRSCDLHAIEIQDRTFVRGPVVDADYAARRASIFVVAVQCGQAGGTCFCASMQTGPRATEGFDLALTELLEPHRFVVEVGSERGGALLARVAHTPASAGDVAAADARVDEAARSMGRALDTAGIRDLLYGNAEHPRWDEVAARCLGCTNCTLVCPTCFCSTVEDTTDLAGETAERWRRWDSCFTLDHSYLHGGGIRGSLRSRYRQWLTHKVASWIDQFGVSGCVGCGRCITWCPVGIDITEELAAIRATRTDTAPGAPA